MGEQKLERESIGDPVKRLISAFQALATDLEGEFYYDATIRTLYSTDASVYRELPQAAALPKTEEDIRKLIFFANANGTSLIPRTAGTSLAGQVVGGGIVVDVSRHFRRIVQIDGPGKRVRVQPGMVRNELNLALAPHQLFFAPETSTQNRCRIRQSIRRTYRSSFGSSMRFCGGMDYLPFTMHTRVPGNSISALPGTVIAAPGTSCRHQIKDGAGCEAKHPVEILHDALA